MTGSLNQKLAGAFASSTRFFGQSTYDKSTRRTASASAHARTIEVEIPPTATTLLGGRHIGCGGTLRAARFVLGAETIEVPQCDRCQMCWYTTKDLKTLRRWLARR